MAAFRALVENKLGALQNLSAFSKVDNEATRGISADQEVLHTDVLLRCGLSLGLRERGRIL